MTTTPRLHVRGLQSAQAGPFDLDLLAGGCMAIVGRSGAGKSLFLRLLADLDPGVGTVVLDGQDRALIAAPAWRRQVIYQPAEPAWWDDGIAAHFPTEDRTRAVALARALHLPADVFDLQIGRLSTGERQRLALVRSLVRRPAVLLLDEPSASLDAASTADLEALLHAERAAGMAMIVVTHAREQAARLGNHVFEMIDRRLHPL